MPRSSPGPDWDYGTQSALRHNRVSLAIPIVAMAILPTFTQPIHNLHYSSCSCSVNGNNHKKQLLSLC